MTIKPLYEFEEQYRKMIVDSHLRMRFNGIVSGPVEGAYGEIYHLTMPENTFPRYLAAKCPKLKRFGSPEKAREGVEQVLHELEKCHQVHMVPWVNRFSDLQLIHGWPFVWSRYRDGTLEDLIANPLAWTTQDRLASLIQIARALSLAKSKGITAHQDLKPGNVFFDDMAKKGIPKGSSGMHFHMYVADFGLADAFKDLGRNNGSRPYMAPEQFSAESAHLHTSESFDIFSLGVMTHECLLDGLHPIGEVTRDVWQWRPGIPQKWNHESTWREWAQSTDKKLPIAADDLPGGIRRLILRCLSADPAERPSLDEYEAYVWTYLNGIDGRTAEGLRMQIDYIEGLSAGDDAWPHMDEQVIRLRKFYSEL